MNLQLDNFSPEYVERMSTATCPDSGHKVAFSVLVVCDDGVWETGPRGSPGGEATPDG